MKTCPRCNKTYPDTELFCDADGTALVSAGPAFTHGSGDGSEERRDCPVCGGKAEPGELICNFCGARLGGDESTGKAAPAIPVAPQPAAPPRSAPTQVPPRPAEAAAVEEEQGRGIFGTIAYVTAAIIALVAGAWFALHLSSRKQAGQPVAQVSPSVEASPAITVSGPLVTLANGLPVQVSGAASTSPDRSTDVARKGFEDNKGSLLDVYNKMLGTDAKLADGMVARIHVTPDGTVDKAAVRTSTAPNPSLDAEVAKAMLGWKFPPSSAGDAEADYPIVFAHDSAEQARIEGDLQSKIASLPASETPEYASDTVPAPAASPAVAGGGASPAAGPSPEVAAIPPSPEAMPSPPAPPVAAKPHRPRVASAPKPVPSPSLLEVVQQRLASDRRLRRVKAYTASGTVTLYGRVFDDDTKMLAERTVKNVPGVTGVVDTLTTDTAEWAEQQVKIARQLQNAGLDKVTVKVIGHDAYLNGQVKTDLEKQRAVTIAEGAAPVTVRENLIRVEPGNMFGF